METLHFDLTKAAGHFKLLNATNGGPWHKRHATDQWRSNFEDYRAARIPYSRNHDSALCGSTYGGPYSHDITAIFPNFDADPTDPASYDFACPDESILVTLDAGTRTFFRLGQSIEHQIKKHGTLPPRDFHKWAVICEHIIRHYTEGWADGYHLDMPYWEIWNEPDLDADDSANKRCWGGTRQQFFELYEITAKHLKACFPHLKIGGPALANAKPGAEWPVAFLRYMREHNVEIDFFSWHVYLTEPQKVVERAAWIRRILDENGYGATESILNEWNYVRDWRASFKYSIQMIHGAKGGALLGAVIAAAQRTSIDMLMYYDTRPGAFNGVFDYYTYDPLKGYFPMCWYGHFYDLAAEAVAENNVENIYPLCGVDADGKVTAMLSYYSENDETPEKTLKLDFGREGKYEVYLVDNDHHGELWQTTSDLTLTLKVHSVVLIREL